MNDFAFKPENQFSQRRPSELGRALLRGGLVLVFLLFMALCGAQAWAADYYWIGDTSGVSPVDWDDVNNWSNTQGGASAGSVPGASDSAHFMDTGGSYSFANNITVGNITVATSTSLTFGGTVEIGSYDDLNSNSNIVIESGGKLQINSTNDVTIPLITNSGTVENIGDANLTITSLVMAADSTITHNVSGAVDTVIETLSGAFTATLQRSGSGSLTVNNFDASTAPAVNCSGSNIHLGTGTVSSINITGGEIVLDKPLTVTGDVTITGNASYLRNDGGGAGELIVNGDVNVAGGHLGRSATNRPLKSLIVNGTLANSGEVAVKESITFGGDFANTGTFTTAADATILVNGNDDITINTGASAINVASFTYAPSNVHPAKTLTITNDGTVTNSFGDFTAITNTGNAKIIIDGNNEFADFTTAIVSALTMDGNNTFTGDFAASGNSNITLTGANTFNGKFTFTGEPTADPIYKPQINLSGANTFDGDFTFSNGEIINLSAAQTINAKLALSGRDADHPLEIKGSGGSLLIDSSQELGQFLKIDAANVSIASTASDKYYLAKNSEFFGTQKFGVIGNWIVLNDNMEFTWAGTNSAAWSLDSNWDAGLVPGIEHTFDTIIVDATKYKVLIPDSYTNAPQVDAAFAATYPAFTVKDLQIGEGVSSTATLEFVSQINVAVTDVFTNYGTVIYPAEGRITDGANQTNDIGAAHGGTVKYSADTVTTHTDLGAVEYCNLIIEDGATVKSSKAVVVNGNAQNAGTINLSHDITFKGDFENAYSGDDGTFSSTKKVIATGTSAQIDGGTNGITADSFEYTPLDATGTPAPNSASLTLKGDNTFANDFVVEDAGGATLVVNGTQTINGNLSLSGTSTDFLTIDGGSASGKFAVSANQVSKYLSIDRTKVEITAIGTGGPFNCLAVNSEDSTGDDTPEVKNWYIIGSNIKVTWKGGGAASAWTDPENWKFGSSGIYHVVPGIANATVSIDGSTLTITNVDTTGASVLIPDGVGDYPTAAAAYTLNDLEIGEATSSDATVKLSSGNDIKLTGTVPPASGNVLENYGTIIYAADGRITNNNATPKPINDVAHDGTVQYTGNTEFTAFETSATNHYANLIVDSGVTLTGTENIIVNGNTQIDGSTLEATSIKFNGDVTIADDTTFNAEVELASGKNISVENPAGTLASATVIFGGDFTNKGEYKAAGSKITFGADFDNTSGIFTDDTAKITATNENAQIKANGIKAASFTYAPVDASGTSVAEGSLTISGDNTWGDFTFGTDGNGIKGTLTVNGEQTIDGALTLVGNGVTDLLVITTASAGSFVIGVNDQTSGQCLRVIKGKVKINDGSSDGFFYAKDSSYDSDPDFGEHQHWVLLNDGMQFVWTAESVTDKTDWADATNWNLGMVPGLDIATSGAPMDTRYYNVTIPDTPTGGEFPKIGAAQEYVIKDLKVGENNSSPATLELAANSDIVLNDNDGDPSTKPKLNNFGTIIYSAEGRIVDDSATPKPINDVAKGKVEYKGNAKTLTEFVDPNGTTSNYFDLQIDSDAVLTSGGDIIVANNATISGTTSGVKSFTVTKKTSFEDASSAPVSFTTTGDQTYKDEVTVSTELSLGTKNITFEKDVASTVAITITNSGVFKTGDGANIDLSGGGTLAQNSSSTGESQIGGSIITDDTTSNDIVVFKNDVYIYGNAASTFGGGSGNFALAGNLHIAADASAVKTIASPLTAKNIILYSGTLSLAGTDAALTTTQDLVLLGDGYNVDDKNDATQSQVENLFAYNHGSRDGTTHAKHSYTDTFKTQCPDGATDIPDGSATNKFKGKLNVALDKTITVGKNFYGNGIAITGAGDWNLVIPDNNSQASAFAELYNSSITNCKVAPSAGGTQAFVAAAENCSTIDGCDGVFKSRLVIDSVRMVYDDVLEVSFKYAASTDDVYLENSKGEIAKAASQIILGDDATGVTVKIYRTFDAATGACGGECTTGDTTDIAPSTNLEGDAATVLYIKAAKKWNTDATGVYAGSEESTDRTGKHQTTIPYLNIPKALDSLYETIRDNRKNRIAHYYSATPDVGAADKTMNDNAGKTYTKIEDKCAPVLIAVYTGQELHSITGQTDYDAHNFIEFVYSEPVNVGDGTINVTKTDVNQQATADLGKTTNDSDGFTVAGIAKFTKGKINASLKPSAAGDSPHSLYRNFAIKAADAPADQPCRVRLAVAGYVDGTVAGVYKNWVGYITSATCPANDSSVTAETNANLKDLNGNSIDAVGVTNYNLPTLKVKQSLVESGVAVVTMYGTWDVTPPSFAPMRVNGENNWHSPYNPTAAADPTSCEIVGYVSSGTYLTELEVHMFDNEPKYTSADTYQWYSRVGWAVPAASNTYGAIQSDTADLIGGSRPFAANARTSGGIRTCTLAGAESAFSYVASSSPSSDNFASIKTGAQSAYFSTIVETRTSNAVPASDSNYFKLVFAGGKELSADATFEVTFNSTLCYITDLAGNRIQCGEKTLKSIDRTPPSFNITAVPLGTNKMLIVFADEVNVGTIKLKKNAAATPDELPALKYIPKALKLTTATSGIDIDQDVPAQVAFTNSKATAIVVTLKQNAVLNDITEGIFVEVIKSDEYSYDSITGTTDAKVTYIQDPVGNFVQAGKKHAFSDFAVNAVQMQYAYSVVDPEADGEPERFDVHAMNQSTFSARDWSAEQKSSGSVKVGKEIIMNGFLYDGTLENDGGVAGKDVTAYFTHTPEAASISKDFNSLTGKNWRIWLPTAYGSISDVANTVFDHTVTASSTKPMDERQSFDIDISKTDAESFWHDGDQIKFLFELNGCTVDHFADGHPQPLYCLRLKNPADLTSLDLWSFITRNATMQRGSVTILNNVINVDAGERTTIQIQTESPEKIKVIVMTLDGNIVKYLDSYQFDDSSYYYIWDGKNKGGTPVARGLYFIRVIGPGIDETRKVMCVK